MNIEVEASGVLGAQQICQAKIATVTVTKVKVIQHAIVHLHFV